MLALLTKERATLATAIMFLTRLPVGAFASAAPEELARSARYFPLVGFMVGAVLCGALVMLLQVFPVSVAIVLMLLLSVRLTGAFHEDGLADVADSAGAFNVEGKLEIMRDSRVGTYGSLALILLILLKFSTLWELVQIELSAALVAIVTAHILRRWSSVWLMAHVKYARPEAAKKVVAEGIHSRRLLESSLWAGLLMLPAAWWFSPWVYGLYFIAWLVAFGSARRFRQVFGGITGDCLGSVNQVVEVVIYLSVLATSSW